MLAGELPPVAGAAFAEGREGLARFRLEVLRPVKPMLAQTAEDVATAIDRTGRAAAEWKLDGARLQVHRLGSEVRAFTRSLARRHRPRARRSSPRCSRSPSTRWFSTER